MGIAGGGVGGGTVVPRSTASQMQRGSGELQSTPTGFWKLQSDPAGAGHGSIAAGIGARSLLRSTSLTAHMGRTHTQVPTPGRGQCPDAEIQEIQSSQERMGGFSGACRSSFLDPPVIHWSLNFPSLGSNPSLSLLNIQIV